MAGCNFLATRKCGQLAHERARDGVSVIALSDESVVIQHWAISQDNHVQTPSCRPSLCTHARDCCGYYPCDYCSCVMITQETKLTEGNSNNEMMNLAVKSVGRVKSIYKWNQKRWPLCNNLLHQDLQPVRPEHGLHLLIKSDQIRESIKMALVECNLDEYLEPDDVNEMEISEEKREENSRAIIEEFASGRKNLTPMPYLRPRRQLRTEAYFGDVHSRPTTNQA